MGCRLAMRLYGVYMRLYGVCMAYYGVYIVGYAIMAYGLGLRGRRVGVGVACVVGCVYGVQALGVPCRCGLSVGYGVYVWQVWRVVGVCRRWCTVCVGVVYRRWCTVCVGVCGYGVQALGVRMVIVCMCRVVYVVCTLCVYVVCIDI